MMRHSGRRRMMRAALWTMALFVFSIDAARAEDGGSSLTPAPRAPAEVSASELSEQGLSLYKARDYRRAAEKFLQAYAIDPDPNLLFNVARCYQSLGDDAAAIEKYEAYLRSPNIDPIGKERAERALKSLQDLGDTKASGQRSAEKSSPGDASARGRDTTLTTEGDRASSRSAAERATADARQGRDGTAVTAGWIATAALAAGTVATGLFAIDSAHQLSAARQVYPGDPARLDDLAKRTTAFSVTADVLGVATVVTAAFSLYWTITRPSVKSEVKAAVLPSGVALRGSFQ